MLTQSIGLDLHLLGPRKYRVCRGYNGLIFLIWALRSILYSLGYSAISLSRSACRSNCFQIDVAYDRSRWLNNISFTMGYIFHLCGLTAGVRGAEIIMYFYSTNSEPIQRSKGEVPPQNMYSLMNWPRYLVWDEFQANVVSAYSSTNPVISIVGPIWFSDHGGGMLDIHNNSVAIFDIQPHRLQQYCSYGSPFEY